jgi:hypothetical protein
LPSALETLQAAVDVAESCISWLSLVAEAIPSVLVAAVSL